MTKFCCVWGLALVATLGLLGGALAYPDALAPVSDNEAAALVGGANPCDCWQRYTCTPAPYCTSTVWASPADTSQCTRTNEYGYNPMTCSQTCNCSCVTCYGATGPCITKCPPAP
jgi:hypothetical protein